MGDIPAMIRVRRSAGRNHADNIPGRNRIGVCPANPGLRTFAKRINPARPHVAYPAAYAQQAETALRLHLFVPVPYNLNLFRFRAINHFARGFIRMCQLLSHFICLRFDSP